MKVLSVKEPWYSCLLHHGKRTENRSWRPPTNLIGKRIALHASKKSEPASVNSHAARLALYTARQDETIPPPTFEKGKGYKFDKGYNGRIAGTAVVAGYVTVNEAGDVDCHHAPDWYEPDSDVWLVRQAGNVGWILEDVQLLDVPVSAKGQLGLWDFDLELTA